MNGLLGWWDGIELWLSGRGFILQTVIVMPVVLLLAYVIAVVGDKVLYLVLTTLSRLNPAPQQPADAEAGSA